VAQFLWFFSVFFRSILSGEGEMMFPMKVLGAGTILNIILNPIFIYYYQIAGAAICTVISQ
jgi:Na+-driven multidrug efflux pump